MEDKKLMSNKNIFDNIISKKRRGFGLLLALVVLLGGLVMIAVMYNSVSMFSRTFSEYRHGYVDAITAHNFIERTKGNIVAFNNAQGAAGGSVLHSAGNNDPNFNVDIDNLEGLVIARNNFDIKENGEQRVEVEVLDANYRVGSISPAFPPDEILHLPPSFFAGAGGMGVHEFEEIGDSGYDYNQFDVTGPGGTGAGHRNYGAYLIRVRVYNTSLVNDQPRLVRTTEEAFVQVIP